MTISETIKDRLRSQGVAFTANDNISDHLNPDELDKLQSEVEKNCQLLLDSLIIEPDHNTTETARRMAKMFIREVFRGRYEPMPKITDFPNVQRLDEIYAIGPITVRSACSHHFVPILGKLWIGVLPSDRVIGISKFVRLADWVLCRPQIQEEATVMLADKLEELIKPKGLAIVMDAQHQCMTWRGVKESNTTMTTSVMRGVFLNVPEARIEFLKLIEKSR